MLSQLCSVLSLPVPAAPLDTPAVERIRERHCVSPAVRTPLRVKQAVNAAACRPTCFAAEAPCAFAQLVVSAQAEWG